jgi:hypothetical protein
MNDLYREPIDEKSEAPAAPSAKSSVEQEILELEKKLAAKRASLTPEAPKPLEQVLETEQAATKKFVQPDPQKISAPLTPPVIQKAKDEAEAFRGMEKNQQLKGLVDLAFQKGVIYAAEVVRNLDNPYLMDEFHDTLADHLHKELVEKGKLEEI